MDLHRIILMDDKGEVRQSIIRKIDWTGVGFCVVRGAKSGEGALEKVEVLKPGLILIDIRTPSIDGLPLTERVRQKYPSVKTVIFSGYDDFSYAKQAIKLNVMECVLKPVNMGGLMVILKRIRSNLDDEIK